MNKLAVIPAKGRSTRLPGKNLAQLGGRPLVVWSIDAARDSGLFDRIIVSTDDEGIAAVARAAGAEVPFIRRSELTVDGVEVDAVIHDAVKWCAASAMVPEWVCTLQPTSPLRRGEHIRAAWQLLADEPTATGLVAVSPYGHHPLWALRIHEGGLVPLDPDHCMRSRSELPELVHPNGCLYWQKGADILARRGRYGGRILAYVTPHDAAVDVDEPEDLAYAEWLLTMRSND